MKTAIILFNLILTVMIHADVYYGTNNLFDADIPLPEFPATEPGESFEYIYIEENGNSFEVDVTYTWSDEGLGMEYNSVVTVYYNSDVIVDVNTLGPYPQNWRTVLNDVVENASSYPLYTAGLLSYTPSGEGAGMLIGDMVDESATGLKSTVISMGNPMLTIASIILFVFLVVSLIKKFTRQGA